MPSFPLYLTLAGLVNQDMSARVFQTMTTAIRDGHEEVHLLIQSTGGFIGDGIAIHNFLSALPIKLVTYNVGYVASIAVPIYLAGQRRIAARTATFMIHRTHTQGVSGVAAIQTAAATALRIDEENSVSILREALKIPEAQWAIYANADLTFTAEDGVNYGAVHELGLFAPPHGAPLYTV